MNLVRDILGTSFGILILFIIFSIPSLNILVNWQKSIILFIICAAIVVLWGEDYLR